MFSKFCLMMIVLFNAHYASSEDIPNPTPEEYLASDDYENYIESHIRLKLMNTISPLSSSIKVTVSDFTCHNEAQYSYHVQTTIKKPRDDEVTLTTYSKIGGGHHKEQQGDHHDEQQKQTSSQTWTHSQSWTIRKIKRAILNTDIRFVAHLAEKFALLVTLDHDFTLDKEDYGPIVEQILKENPFIKIRLEEIANALDSDDCLTSLTFPPNELQRFLKHGVYLPAHLLREKQDPTSYRIKSLLDLLSKCQKTN